MVIHPARTDPDIVFALRRLSMMMAHMPNLLRLSAFFNDVISTRKPLAGHSLVITHFLPDRPALMDAIDKLAPIGKLIGKEYSADPKVFQDLRDRFGDDPVEVWHDSRLSSAEELLSAAKTAAAGGPLVIIEIGGYFAPHIAAVHTATNAQLLGVVEDTEFGHRRYQEALARQGSAALSPVVSVARSPLKAPEDALVGPSCVYSVERLLREAGEVFAPRRCIVVGYGRVGRGTAQCLRGRVPNVSVCEIDPVRRALAIAEGFDTPDLAYALADVDAVFGCTGTCVITAQHMPLLRNGVILASCSSRTVEFDVGALTNSSKRKELTKGLVAWVSDGRTVLVAHEGQPVNFLHNAEIGPVLALVQAEILVAIAKIPGLHPRREVIELDDDERGALASHWLRSFTDEKSGRYIGL